MVSEHRALYPRSKCISGWSEPHVTSDSPTCLFHGCLNPGSQSLKILQGTRDKYSRLWAPTSALRILHCGRKRRGSPDSPETDTSKASHRNTLMGVKDARPCLEEDTAWACTGPEPGPWASPPPSLKGSWEPRPRSRGPASPAAHIPASTYHGLEIWGKRLNLFGFPGCKVRTAGHSARLPPARWPRSGLACGE